jgi:hypothetical protein
MYNTIRSDGFTNAPACPSTHPVRVPQVTFETVWDTTKFNSMWTSGPNPYVWSFEGSNGRGTHADYMFGWKSDSLEKAMEKSECFYDGCGSIKKQAMSEANKCSVKDQIGEETLGCKFKRDVGVMRMRLLTCFSRVGETSGDVRWKLLMRMLEGLQFALRVFVSLKVNSWELWRIKPCIFARMLLLGVSSIWNNQLLYHDPYCAGTTHP